MNRAFRKGQAPDTTGAKIKLRDSLAGLSVYLKPYRPLIVIAVLCALAGTIFSIVGPVGLKKITDLINAGFTAGIDMAAVRRVGFSLAALYGGSVLLSYAQGFIMATVTQNLSKCLRTNIASKINRLPLKYFDSTSYGDVLSRVTNDVDTIGHTLNQSVGMLTTSAVMFAGSLVMMLYINLILAAVTIVSSLAGFALMSTIVSKSQKYFRRQQEGLGAIGGHVEEVYTGHNVVKAYNAEEDNKKRFEEINKGLYTSAWKSQFLSGLMMPLMNFIGNFGYVAVCVAGAALALNNIITFGVIVAFMVYVRFFTQPLSQFAQAMTSLQSAGAASNRVLEFLQEEELEDESHKTEALTEVKGDIEFKNVRFGYKSDKTIIKSFSAHAKPGQKIAIVGPTGAGKTTLVNLLMRFYELDGGEIIIDGIPARRLSRENIHALFCMVLQDTWLFGGTIRENIIYNKQNVSDEMVTQACKTVGIHHFIRTLPQGYDTVLDESTSISAGQKQLLTIARAIVENSPLLILDEATSSVDTRTEALIQKAMEALTVGRTSFVIAHRLSTIRNADLILCMDNGDIVEQGTHDELMAKDGFYRSLYNSQFEN